MTDFVMGVSLEELERMGCRIGQEVLFQIHKSKKKTEIRVYDAKTKKLIGVVKR